jgi:hypothetical protein
MTEEQAFASANPDGGVYAPGAFVLALGTLKAEPRKRAADAGDALGAQAGEAAIRQVVTDAGSPGSAVPPRPRSTWSSRYARKRPRGW